MDEAEDRSCHRNFDPIPIPSIFPTLVYPRLFLQIKRVSLSAIHLLIFGFNLLELETTIYTALLKLANACVSSHRRL